MKESQLENKTAIATNNYVRMVDENGNSVKIKKDSFMAAIRDALPSIISDGETGGGSVLSIINGALKSRTDANLASVLGEYFKTATTHIDNIKEAGTWLVPSDYVDGVPDGFNVQLAMKVIKVTTFDIIQTIYRTGGGGKMAIRTSASASTWNAWKVIVS